MHSGIGIYQRILLSIGCGRQGDGMGATQLPTPGINGTGLDQQSPAGGASSDPAAEMIQLLGPDGKLGTDPVFSDYAKRLDPEQLRGFYADMAKVRRFDQEATRSEEHTSE